MDVTLLVRCFVFLTGYETARYLCRTGNRRRTHGETDRQIERQLETVRNANASPL